MQCICMVWIEIFPLYTYIKRDNFFVFGSTREGEKVKKVKAMFLNLLSETQYNGQSPVRFSIHHIHKEF